MFQCFEGELRARQSFERIAFLIFDTAQRLEKNGQFITPTQFRKSRRWESRGMIYKLFFSTYRARLAVDSFLQFHNRAKIKTKNENEKIFSKFFLVF